MKQRESRFLHVSNPPPELMPNIRQRRHCWEAFFYANPHLQIPPEFRGFHNPGRYGSFFPAGRPESRIIDHPEVLTPKGSPSVSQAIVVSHSYAPDDQVQQQADDYLKWLASRPRSPHSKVLVHGGRMRSWYYPGVSHLVLFAPDHIDIDINYPVSAVPEYDLHGEFLRRVSARKP